MSAGKQNIYLRSISLFLPLWRGSKHGFQKRSSSFKELDSNKKGKPCEWHFLLQMWQALRLNKRKENMPDEKKLFKSWVLFPFLVCYLQGLVAWIIDFNLLKLTASWRRPYDKRDLFAPNRACFTASPEDCPSCCFSPCSLLKIELDPTSLSYKAVYRWLDNVSWPFTAGQ